MGIRITVGGRKYEAESYSLGEAATPIAAGDTSGQVGTLDIVVPFPDADLAPNHPVNKYGAQVLIDDEVVLRDSRRGWTIGRVAQVSTNDESGTFTLSCVTRLAELNAYNVQAQPFVGSLEAAFAYYLSLSPVQSDWFVDPDIQNRQVEFPGWNGELWFHLKQMATALDVEISFVSGIVLLRPIRARQATRGREMSRALTSNAVQLAQAVEVYRYNNRAITNELVYPAGGWTSEVQILSVNAGEETEQRIELGASLSQFQVPVMKTFVSKAESDESVYTIVADDGLPVQPAAWKAFGGSVAFELNPDTVSMTVKMVGAQGLPTAEGVVSRSFSLALAADTSGSRYSTLRIVGTGVAFKKEVIRVPTGVSAQRTGTDVGETVDNPFISTLNDAYTAGVRAAKKFAGYTPSLSGTVVALNRRGDSGAVKNVEYRVVQTAFKGLTYGQVEDRGDHAGHTYREVYDGWFAFVGSDFTNQTFGNAAGSRVWNKAARRWFRIRSVTADAAQIRFEAEDDLTHGDIEPLWSGSTYGEVQARMGGLSYQKSFLIGIRSMASFEHRRNLVLNPIGPGSPVDTALWRATGSLSSVTDGGRQVLRATETIEASSLYIDPFTNFTAQVGDTIRWSADVMTNDPDLASTMRTTISTYNGASIAAVPVARPVSVNQWTRVSVEAVVTAAPEGHYFRTLMWPSSTATDLTSWIQVRDWVVEIGPSLPADTAFFDGSTTAPDGRLYKWTGTPNASPSTEIVYEES